MKLQLAAICATAALQGACAELAILPGVNNEAKAYITTDGETWSVYKPPFGTTAACSSGSELYLMGMHQQTFDPVAIKSSDGKTWSDPVKIPTIVVECEASDGNIYASGYNGGVIRSTDGGDSYDLIYKTKHNIESFNSILKLDSTLITFGDYDDPTVGDYRGNAIEARLSVGNVTWTEVKGDWFNNGGYALQSAISCPGVVLVGDDTGNYYVAEDKHATTWSDRIFLNNTLGVGGSVCIGDTGVWLVQHEDMSTSQDAILCVSDDSAKTFDCSTDLTLAHVKPLKLYGKSASSVFATSRTNDGLGESTELWHTTNGGKHWEKVLP